MFGRARCSEGVREVAISELDFIRAAQSALADRYGGMWIEGGVYSVAVVERTQADSALLASLAPAGATVQALPAKYSYAELTTLGDRALQALAKAEFQVTTIGPRPQIGKIVITVPASNTDVQNALASAIPEDSFVVETSKERAVAKDGE
jgi:hypothetical protein